MITDAFVVRASVQLKTSLSRNMPSDLSCNGIPVTKWSRLKHLVPPDFNFENRMPV